MKKICVVLSIAFCFVLALLLWVASVPDHASAQACPIQLSRPSSSPSYTPQDCPPKVVTLSNGYRITFLDVTYNDDCTSTWRYYVEELPGAQDLSNWVLELPSCVGVVTASPEPWWLEHPDPNTHLNGIKWGTAGLPGAGEFTVTLNGHWAVGTRAVAAKGPDVAWGEIAGPICEPAALVAGEKMVDPTMAQPGDVLTYTLVLTNEDECWPYTAVLTDPIPAGTTYVGASAQATSGSVQYDQGEDLIHWQGTLAPKEVATITFMVWVNDDVSPGTQITNRATLGDDVLTATTWIEAAENPAWVLLVYLSADNNLDNFDYRVIRDWEAFNALERAAVNNPRLRIYVQWDRSPNHADDWPDDHTRRYRVRPDLNPFQMAPYVEGVDTWDLGEENMGDSRTLYEFIVWARGHYTSAYDALSIIGHGGGWSPDFEPGQGYTDHLPSGIAWDDSSGDYLATSELGEALYWATNEQADPFGVLFLDASMMAMLENAYQVRDSAQTLVASQGAAWARFAYDRYLDGVDETTTARAFATQIVTEYAASLEGYPLTMGAIAVDTAALEPVVQAVDDLAITLSNTLTDTRPYVSQAYALVQKFDSNWDMRLEAPDAHVDLYDFADQLYQLLPATETELLAAAQGVMDSLSGGQAIVAETHRDGHPWMEPTVTWTFSGAHGVSIYLPLGEDSWLRDYYRGTELDLAADTQWDEFIHDGWYAGQMPPPLPSVEQATLQGINVPKPIDPATRPGLLGVQRFWSFVPLVAAGQ